MPKCTIGKKCGRACITKRNRCHIRKTKTKRGKGKQKEGFKFSSIVNGVSLGTILKCKNMTARAQKTHFNNKPGVGWRNAIRVEDGLCTPMIIRK